MIFKSRSDVCVILRERKKLNVNKNNFGAVLFECFQKRKVIVKNITVDDGGQNNVSLIFRTSRWRIPALLKNFH
ncbi:type VI secretion system contractile sheath small subunit [Raoultella terrigena]|nr:type VI secretion system contractile sheath small subunit [Raoultella terrigena]